MKYRIFIFGFIASAMMFSAIAQTTDTSNDQKMDPKAAEYYTLALEAIKADKFEESVKYADSSLAVQKDHRTYYLLGSIYLKEGVVDKAKENFNQSLALNKNNENAHKQLAQASLMNKEYDEAKKHYQDAISVSTSDSAKAIYNELLADVDTRKDQAKKNESIDMIQKATANAETNPDEAIKLLDEAYASSKNPAALYEKGRIYLKQKKNKEAAAAFTEATTADPKNYDAYIGLAQTQVLDKKYGEAAATYQKALDNSENGNREALYKRIAEMYLADKKYDQSLATLDSLQATKTTITDGEVAFYRALNFLGKKDKESAKEQFTIAAQDEKYKEKAETELAKLEKGAKPAKKPKKDAGPSTTK